MARATLVRSCASAVALFSIAACAPKPTMLVRLTDPGVFDVPPHRSRHASDIAVRPFVDERSRVWSESSTSGSIPFVFLFHIGGVEHYPEHRGYLGKPKSRRQITLGDLATDIPELLAHSLGGASVGDDTCGHAEYIVSGAILETKLDWDYSMALGLVALLGVPTRFAHVTLRVRVAVHHRNRPNAPLWSRIYVFDERRTGGLYRTAPEEKLMRTAVQSVLDRAARDIERVVARASG
jgi:hypothetical protein